MEVSSQHYYSLVNNFSFSFISFFNSLYPQSESLPSWYRTCNTFISFSFLFLFPFMSWTRKSLFFFRNHIIFSLPFFILLLFLFSKSVILDVLHIWPAVLLYFPLLVFLSHFILLSLIIQKLQESKQNKVSSALFLYFLLLSYVYRFLLIFFPLNTSLSDPKTKNTRVHVERTFFDLWTQELKCLAPLVPFLVTADVAFFSYWRVTLSCPAYWCESRLISYVHHFRQDYTPYLFV